MATVRIAPSILASDFGRLAEEIQAVTDAGADLIHVDVMDGHFTPNITIGPPVVAALRRYCTLPMDVHLMIADPERYVNDFAQAGADMISFHIEATPHPHRIIEQIRAAGCQAGIVINPGTSEDAIEYVADLVDFTLVMTVNPGFGGQAFIPDMIRKIENVRAMMGARPVEVDGGIDEVTAADAVRAGADILVAGSFVFRHDSYAGAIAALRAAADTPR